MLKPLTQVVCTPMHTHGDISHPDCQFGFVTTFSGDDYFVRYWVSRVSKEVRTRCNGERTPGRYIQPCMSHDQKDVIEMWRKILSEVDPELKAFYDSQISMYGFSDTGK